MKAKKFLYISEGSSEGTLLASDGGIAIIWHNGEHIIGQCYQERIALEEIETTGLSYAFDKMCGSSSNSALFDYEEEDEVHPSQLQELADWLMPCNEEEFLESLIFINSDKVTQTQLDKKVKKFLKRNAVVN